MRVLIVDDDAGFRSWLHAALSSDERFEIIGEAVNGAEAVTMASKLTPDLVLMDISMPVMDGIKATARINANCPDATVVLVSGLDNGESNPTGTTGVAGQIKKSEFTVTGLTAILER